MMFLQTWSFYEKAEVVPGLAVKVVLVSVVAIVVVAAAAEQCLRQDSPPYMPDTDLLGRMEW